jgi:uncharacterized protein YuzE
MYKIEYDENSRVLKLRLKEVASVDSEVKGNVVMDFDSEGELVNIDVMDVNLEDLANSVVDGEIKVNKA